MTWFCESPLAGALVRVCNTKIATALTTLCTPQKISGLRRQRGFPGLELLALLVDCQILSRVDLARGGRLRLGEGDENLALWDFHDLAFHARSTEGRHANPSGGLYPYAGVIRPPPRSASTLARESNRSARALVNALGNDFAGCQAFG